MGHHVKWNNSIEAMSLTVLLIYCSVTASSNSIHFSSLTPDSISEFTRICLMFVYCSVGRYHRNFFHGMYCEKITRYQVEPSSSTNKPVQHYKSKRVKSETSWRLRQRHSTTSPLPSVWRGEKELSRDLICSCI